MGPSGRRPTKRQSFLSLVSKRTGRHDRSVRLAFTYDVRKFTGYVQVRFKEVLGGLNNRTEGAVRSHGYE